MQSSSLLALRFDRLTLHIWYWGKDYRRCILPGYREVELFQSCILYNLAFTELAWTGIFEISGAIKTKPSSILEETRYLAYRKFQKLGRL